MPANRFGIDMAELYRNKEAISGARTRNKMAELQLGEAEYQIEQRPIIAAKQEARNKLLTDVRGKASTGNIPAQQQLLTIDPENGPAFIDAVGKMSEEQRRIAKESVDTIGRYSATILNAAPEKQALLYQQMLESLPEETRAKMPAEFNPQFLEMSLAKANTMDQILENPQAINVGDTDISYKGGREVERGKVPVKDSGSGSSSGSGSGGTKSADESLMYRQAGELLGGIFDQQGNITNLDPTVRAKVQTIAEVATKLYNQGGLTRTEAVSRAAEKYGIEMPLTDKEKKEAEATTAPANDPLNIR